MDIIYKGTHSFKEFYEVNESLFRDLLLKQGKNLWESIKKSDEITDEIMINSSCQVVRLLNNNDENKLIWSAKEQGEKWAKIGAELMPIMEWFQLVKRHYWNFLLNYYQYTSIDFKALFELEREVNTNIDLYIHHFSASYTAYKNQLLDSQYNLIDDLNVPVIPLSDTFAILPIIGNMDTRRAERIQLKVLEQIHKQRLQHIIIDLSGVPTLDTDSTGRLIKIINGIRHQGCIPILTGIRPEITRLIVKLGMNLQSLAVIKGTLKQALLDYKKGLL